MPITSFSFNDRSENWHFEEISFENFNLLVGISGVGKTKILKALEFVCRVATGGDYKLNGETWTIAFKIADQEYEWTLESSLAVFDSSRIHQVKPSTIILEEIVSKKREETITLLKRSDSAFLLNNEKVPRFRKFESAINLFSQIEIIKPIFHAFKSFIFSDILQQKHFGTRINPQEKSVNSLIPLEEFKAESIQLPTVVKAYRLQQRYSEEFSNIKQIFTKIFDSVEDIKANITKEKGGIYEYSFSLKEKTSPNWIYQWQMSAGMFRTIVHLIEISLAPSGCVIVIDELENGLGTNCMPGLTDFLLSKTSHLQVILTSHHPYIINNIPDKTWKLVNRNGGHVSVIAVNDIPQIQTESRLDKFIQLIQLSEYENGII